MNYPAIQPVTRQAYAREWFLLLKQVLQSGNLLIVVFHGVNFHAVNRNSIRWSPLLANPREQGFVSVWVESELSTMKWIRNGVRKPSCQPFQLEDKYEVFRLRLIFPPPQLSILDQQFKSLLRLSLRCEC